MIGHIYLFLVCVGLGYCIVRLHLQQQIILRQLSLHARFCAMAVRELGDLRNEYGKVIEFRAKIKNEVESRSSKVG